MQLAFVLFTQLHNFSALHAYKRYIALLCRSSSTLLPISTGLSSTDGLSLIAGFLSDVLIPHFNFLRPDFFVEDLPDFDTFLLEELLNLRLSLRAGNRAYAQEAAENPFLRIKENWTSLATLVFKKFAWNLGGLEPEEFAKGIKGRLHYNLLAQPDEEDEYTEEGEDAPVVLEM